MEYENVRKVGPLVILPPVVANSEKMSTASTSGRP